MSSMSDPPTSQTNIPTDVPPPRKRHSKLAMLLLMVAGIVVLLFIAIQFIPVHRTNPPVTTQLNWDSEQTKALAYRACMDCHSNETSWPWYSYVAPVSWLVYYDVERGRSELNLSTIGTASGDPRSNPSDQPSDLAYRMGQYLAGGQQRRRPEGFRPEGPFPTPALGQTQRQFPEGGGGFREGDQIAENIREIRMPPANYLLLHPAAKLTTQEKEQLEQGLPQTLALTAQ